MNFLKRIWHRPELTMGAANTTPDSVQRPYRQVDEAQVTYDRTTTNDGSRHE
jgi:hypothetical protein